MRIKAMGVGLAVLAVALARPAAASAQVQTSTETQLAQRAAQFPHEISSLLDLAKLYFDQRRFEEASRTLARAIAVINQEQLLVVPATTRPPEIPGAWKTEGVLRVGGDVKEPKFTRHVNPIYPRIALNAKVEGYVIIELLVGKDGRVKEANVLKPHPLFQDAAVDAVRQWEYEPPMLNGMPVSVIMNVTVQFKLK